MSIIRAIKEAFKSGWINQRVVQKEIDAALEYIKRLKEPGIETDGS